MTFECCKVPTSLTQALDCKHLHKMTIQKRVIQKKVSINRRAESNWNKNYKNNMDMDLHLALDTYNNNMPDTKMEDLKACEKDDELTSGDK